jgi:16S rRNA (guanine527-N7)-methyltransferase
MQKLRHAAENLFGIHLDDGQISLLTRFEKFLLEWNDRINLTAIRDSPGIRIKHFLDSFSCALAWGDHPPQDLVDIGTGAGFPGIPLKILYPGMRLTLVESIGKKADFCRAAVQELQLNGVEVITSRAEDLGQMPAHREVHEWAVARAVANLPVLAEYLLPLVRVGGYMLAQKGLSAPAETQLAEHAILVLGGNTRNLIPVTLPGVVEERFIVVVKKTAATPQLYPRKPGIPAKKPL